MAAGPAAAFQIAPLGSSFEATMTREPESRLLQVASDLARLVKAPVHEEITQLGSSCPADIAHLFDDTICTVRDAPYVTPFVIYGVRWNDLPPFRLSNGEAKSCKYPVTGAPMCRLDQTVRFSTQPRCWACIFNDAKLRAESKRIVGCPKSSDEVAGNLMSRSHFGDLQFLHAMASKTGDAAATTRDEILGWLEFAWKVSTKEFGPEKRLREIQIPVLQDRFACSEWSVSDLYILGRNDKLRPQLHRIALGSVLHLVQDSFSVAHVDRQAAQAEDASCPASPGLRPPGRIREFHSYPGQDDELHDMQDRRDAMARQAAAGLSDAIEATRLVLQLDDDDADWPRALPYFACIFGLDTEPRPSSPGGAFNTAGR